MGITAPGNRKKKFDKYGVEPRQFAKHITKKIGVTHQTVNVWKRGINTPNSYNNQCIIERNVGV